MFDIHQTIQDQYGEIGEVRAENYIDGLMTEFAQSSEAQPVREMYGDIGWTAMMMEYAINHIGCTPPEMTLPDFNEVLFDLFPRKVSVEADKAGSIITELRAFWSFVVRQYGLDNARTILATLDDSAVSRLHKKLADPASFGMAKSFFMMGSKAGFDMTTQEGLAAFQAAYNAQLLARQHKPQQQLDRQHTEPNLPLPTAEQRSSDELKKKRKEKRQQREAKKRNRRR